MDRDAPARCPDGVEGQGQGQCVLFVEWGVVLHVREEVSAYSAIRLKGHSQSGAMSYALWRAGRNPGFFVLDSGIVVW